MTFKAALGLAPGLLLLVGSAKAQDGMVCTNAMLNGDYAFTVSGQFFLPTGPGTFQTVQRQGFAMTHFDGFGNLSQVDLVLSDPSAPPPPGAPPTDKLTGFHTDEKGAYSVHPDCAGTFTINNPELTNSQTGKDDTWRNHRRQIRTERPWTSHPFGGNRTDSSGRTRTRSCADSQ